MPGTWKPLASQPTFNVSTMLLLTDGRVMVQEEATANWHALTPDANGSYINGTWANLAPMSFWRRYYASGVLNDGRVLIIGGEQSGAGGDTNRGEIYNPVTNAWSTIALPPWTTVGDAACCVLPDGRLLIGALSTPACEIYNPATNSWSPAGNMAVRSNEESWILLRDNTVVTPQTFPPYQAEKYNFATNTWKNEGTPPADIIDHVMAEIGPGMLMYNNKVIWFGAANVSGHGKTVIYTPPALPTGTGTWVAGPDIPKSPTGLTLVSNDCPATLLPNGNVLFTASEFENNAWGAPVYFFEYDPATNAITPVTAPPDSGQVIYSSRMILLPSGEVMFGQWTHQLYVYQPTGAPQAAWRPTISSVTHLGFFSHNYQLTGTKLNGLSQACNYGDDCSPATNYPLVRLKNNTTGKVYYARTYGFSTRALKDSGVMSCQFTMPPAAPYGSYHLCVIANGISSPCVNWSYTGLVVKSPYIDATLVLKEQFEHYGKIIAEGDPWDRDGWVIDPIVQELAQRLETLQSSLGQVQSMIQAAQLPAVGKQVAAEAFQEVVAARPQEPKPTLSDEAKEAKSSKAAKVA